MIKFGGLHMDFKFGYLEFKISTFLNCNKILLLLVNNIKYIKCF